MNLLLYFIIFGIVGTFMEVVFTSVINYFATKDRHMVGTSTLWMFVLCGCFVFVVLFVQRYFASQNWVVRGLIYMVSILLMEFSLGFMIDKLFKTRGWNYSITEKYVSDKNPKSHLYMNTQKRFHINGYVSLDYALLWFFVGLLAEHIYLFLQSHLIS